MIIKNKINVGFLLILMTAFISGLSIFLNKFGVAISDPYLFAGLKNSLAALFLVGLVLLSKRLAIKKITKKYWLLLILVGLLGGAIPFLLFFKGLSLTLAVKAGFIHKSMFLIITMLSVLFLKNKPSKFVWLGVTALLCGNILFLNIKPQALNIGDGLIFISVLLWSVEILLSKRLLSDLPVSIVAGARMFFGSIFIWIFLFITGQATLVSGLNWEQWGWVGLTSLLLIGYIVTFYSGLRLVSAVEATSVLALGAPITALLTMIFLDNSLSISAVMGIILMVFGLAVVYKLQGVKLLPWRLLKNR